MMHQLQRLLSIFLWALYLSGLCMAAETTENKLFDFALTPEMKKSDFDMGQSPLWKMIKYIVKGSQPASTFLDLSPSPSNPSIIEMNVRITNNSVFVPGDDAAKAQYGFRRTDVLMNVNTAPKSVYAGVTTFHQSIRLDPKKPLKLQHGYLLTSIEMESGDHVFDIFHGSNFDGDGATCKKTSKSEMLRVRDLDTKVLYQVPFGNRETHNIAVTVDWEKNTLTVFASVDEQPLVKVAETAPNNPKVKHAIADTSKLEYHEQLIRFPCPDAQDAVSTRNDVPHHGIQEQPIDEAIFFSKIFVTSGAPEVSPSNSNNTRNSCKSKGFPSSSKN